MKILGTDYLLATLDFETYYGPKYSLTGLNTFAYVDDPRFSIHGLGVQIEDGQARWFRDTEKALAWIEDTACGRPIALVGQNLYFDGWILHRKFDWHPDFYIDTMGMSRALFPTAKASLEALCERLWPNDPRMRKGKELVQFKGVTTEQLWANPQLEQVMADYCVGNPQRMGDVPLTYHAFQRMFPHFPDDELRLIDLTLRMHCEPMLRIDTALVQQAIAEATAERNAKLAAARIHPDDAAPVPEKVLASNQQFEALLRSLGLPIPLKPSDTAVDEHGNPVMIPALGKDDVGFRELMQAYPQYRALFEGRIAAKSVGEVTRGQRFQETAAQCDGYMPVPLIYYSAHTGRYGGGEKLNLQNLGRGSKLRRALCVPSHAVPMTEDEIRQMEAA